MIFTPRSLRGAQRGAALADDLVAWLSAGQIDREEFVKRVMWHCRRLDSELFGVVAALARHLANTTEWCTCRTQGTCPACRRVARVAGDIEARHAAQSETKPSTPRKLGGGAP